ncbi:MAG: hypothetical protein A2087_11820 [Spirochaetes bacterium GWD1_61_31]|nr:MAG: hypothetical protein A2Y37_04695 [Spirochaetes bacterium GWB1_60_80]OHD34784.1 MAG: hypothetical protein A2004_08695 [Spirochaetes bacterium GWC1_61_12]OHD41722.1 MAG: hypothetical protein A2087_11820 [Spirochaetes bacterium GWD1_61_31]OHD44612.1 MAG: hypothetical protein A2Y35_11995 [Spirochaetes bacterium GWE1_60_18]OHD57937.1 MAG: hypothetical protein A2Y32_03990 [Spirochaetes bacterium GWF1_60_12]HAP43937.1 1-acyl-sn-glycerol-3-phosphate acyltransferase [Spirochaetaceae bacterium]
MGSILVVSIALLICLIYQIPAAFLIFVSRASRLRGITRLKFSTLRIMMSAFRQYMGIRFQFDKVSSPLPERFLVVANHQSLLDIPVLTDFFRGQRELRFVAKYELGLGIPLISSILRLEEHALVRRTGKMATVMSQLGRFGARCAADQWCPVIFPEGTRANDGVVKVFHSAGFRKLAEDVPLPIVVVAIDGGWQFSLVRKIVFNTVKAHYRVRVVAILPAPGDKTQMLACLQQTRQLISQQLALWRPL